MFSDPSLGHPRFRSGPTPSENSDRNENLREVSYGRNDGHGPHPDRWCVGPPVTFRAHNIVTPPSGESLTRSSHLLLLTLKILLSSFVRSRMRRTHINVETKVCTETCRVESPGRRTDPQRDSRRKGSEVHELAWRNPNRSDRARDITSVGVRGHPGVRTR